MTFRFVDLVGRYRLVVSDALLEFIERALVESSPASDRERIRREALEEAKRSELFIDEDGTIASRSGADEFYRVKVALDESGLHALHFDKPASANRVPSSAPVPDHEPVTLVLVDSNRLVAYQPNKPPAEFRRIG